MGLGDAIMATGEVEAIRKLKPNAKFVIGDGIRSYWNEVFDNNPHIIRGSETNKYEEVIWIDNYEGNRPYRNYGKKYPEDKYNWKDKYTPKKGKIYFTKDEIELSNLFIKQIRKKIGKKKLIYLESNVKKRLGFENRNWGEDRWLKVVSELNTKYEFLEITYGLRKPIDGTINIHGLNFRTSVAVLSKCDLFLGFEGGMHHAAAATSRKSVVLFGGHISPEITGYSQHSNIYSNIKGSPCGSKYSCDHCKECLSLITPNRVIKEIIKLLN